MTITTSTDIFSKLPDDPHGDIMTFLTVLQKNSVARTSRKELERVRKLLEAEARIHLPNLLPLTRRIEILENEKIRRLFSVEEILKMLNLSHYNNNSRLFAFMKNVAKTVVSSPDPKPDDESLLLSLEDVIEKRIRRLDYQRNFKNILIHAYMDYLFSLPTDPYSHLLGFMSTISSPEIRSHLAESFIKHTDTKKKKYQKKTLMEFLNPMARKRLEKKID